MLLLINHCRGYAVNYGHARIEDADIKRGLEAYSNDLVVDTDAELRDLFPTGQNLVYQLIAEETDMLADDLERHYARSAGVLAVSLGSRALRVSADAVLAAIGPYPNWPSRMLDEFVSQLVGAHRPG